MSESDEPFEVVSWKGPKGPLAPAELLKLAGHPPDTAVQAMTIEKFFKDLTEEQTWHGEEEKADVKRYQNLLQIIRQHLDDPLVFRVGKVEVTIFILGHTTAREWVGLRTKAVET